MDSDRTTIEQVRDLMRILIDAVLKDGPTAGPQPAEGVGRTS